jgi:formylglycine-generating enzyme required for sulfatase activity
MSRNFLGELESARAATDQLFALLAPDALYERPVPERHRLIFYLGHLEAFDWNLICRTTLDVPSFQPDFDRLFAFGIDPEPGKQTGDRPSDWPSVGEVARYNSRTRETIDPLLENVSTQIAQVAIEHRLMHAETLAYLFHNLSHEKKERQHQKAFGMGRETSATWTPMIDISAGKATLGRQRDQFGWDNEFDEHSVDVPAFRVSKYKVTNSDYLAFVRAGASPPHFWSRAGDEWLYRGMFETIPLPLDWPVYVTYEQANAYAAWIGKTLPTEAQFNRAAYANDSSEHEYPWGDALPTVCTPVFDFARWDPIPVTATPETDSAHGVSQLVGNGWEWTSTPFAPFPGFEPFPFYPGYSSHFFDGAHYIVKGASQRTARRFLRRSFRNWFRTSYPYIYAAFRLVEN